MDTTLLHKGHIGGRCKGITITLNLSIVPVAQTSREKISFQNPKRSRR
jgi:hypothetical protein